MKKRFNIKWAGLAAVVAAGLAAQAAFAGDLTYASGLPEGHPINSGGILPLIEELRPGMEIDFIGGGQLYSLADALQSVGNGISDLTIVQPSYAASELPHAVMPFNLLLLTRNELAAAGATASTFYEDCPECMEDYARAGALSLANIAIGGYSLMCRDNFETLDDIKGKRVRVTGSLGRWAEHLGGVPVSMTSAEMVESLQRGVLDCVMGFTAWYKSFAIEDSIDSIYNYNIGSTGAVGIVTANRDSWDALTDEQQRTLWNHMPFAISSAMFGYISQDIAARKEAEATGVKVVDGAAEVTPIWEEYRQSEVESVNENASTLGVKDPAAVTDAYLANYDRWLKLVTDAGLGDVHAGGALFDDAQLEEARQKFEQLLRTEIYDKIDPTQL